jgi:hypothetical protein
MKRNSQNNNREATANFSELETLMDMLKNRENLGNSINESDFKKMIQDADYLIANASHPAVEKALMRSGLTSSEMIRLLKESRDFIAHNQ